MESCNSSPHYMKATSSSDAKKENSPGGSELGDSLSISSSGRSALAMKQKAGAKYGSNSKKTLVNLGKVRSFRRRTRSGNMQANEMFDSTKSSKLDTSVNPSSQACDQCYLCPVHRRDGLSSVLPSSSGLNMKNHMPLKTSSNRNLKFLVRRTSFKLKKQVPSNSMFTEDVLVDRATYSSTMKNSNYSISDHVGIHDEGPECGRNSGDKICRYHHCSLHGSCRRDHSSVTQQNRSPNKKRTTGRKKESICLQESPSAESSIQKIKTDSEALSGIQKFDLLENAFGESSFPERSYQEEEEEDDEEEEERTSLGINDNCSSSSWNNGGLFFSTQADSDYPQHQISSSGLGNEFRTISQNEEADILDHKFSGIPLDEETYDFDHSNLGRGSSKIPQNAEVNDLNTLSLTLPGKNTELIYSTKDHSTFNEKSNKNPLPEVTEITKNDSVPLSVADRQSSSDGSSGAEGETSVPSSVIQAIDSETGVPAYEGKELQFSKPRHISMWRLIHQHMASELATEAANNPLQAVEGETQDGVSKTLPVEEGNLTETQHPEFSVANIEVENSPESQEIEVRKLLAIKLVREAIEKILLPEIQDDQSVTSENIHQLEMPEKKDTEASVEESGEESVADKLGGNFSSKPEDEPAIVDDASNSEKVKAEKIAAEPLKKAPKHWSNLKKWILLQRFIKELEKVRTFSPQKPQILAADPNSEAEKVNLRPQAVDERKKGEEWMLDYALRQAVNQLGPTQKRKVSLLVKAFETVVPTQEDSPVPVRISRLRDNPFTSLLTSGGYARHNERVSLDPKSSQSTGFEVSKLESGDETNLPRSTRKTWIGSIDGRSKIKTLSDTSSFKSDNDPFNLRSDRKNHIEMWHMIYQHVLSGIADKFGSQLLNGSDDNDDSEDDKFPQESENFHDFTQSKGTLFHSPRNGFTKIDAVKLVKEAVDEILVTSESLTDQEISEKIPGVQNKYESKPKNWMKLKKLILLQKSIKVLEEAREVKRKLSGLAIESPDTDPQRGDSRQQLMDEKEKAKNWMLDYAVQHIVGRLTPARKRRVSMLVEAFEAVVPFPEI